MALRIFRVCRANHTQLDGEGARLAGGRWNSPGTAVVYMAESISLGVLENLVHMGREDFPTGYVVVSAVIPHRVRVLRAEDLINTSRRVNPRRIGDRWVERRESAVLAVRSAVVPLEHNYLLNPRHPEFDLIRVEAAIPFTFDARLFDIQKRP